MSGFLELDEKLRKIPEVANGEDKSGTTAVCVLITEKYVLFSNCGDSRGVLSGRTGSGNDALASRLLFHLSVMLQDKILIFINNFIK